MVFCYAGLLMVGVIFLLCLWQSFKQWYKGEHYQAQRFETIKELQANTHSPRKDQLSYLEAESRGYAGACLIAASVAAFIELVAGSIIWGCGG